MRFTFFAFLLVACGAPSTDEFFSGGTTGAGGAGSSTSSATTAASTSSSSSSGAAQSSSSSSTSGSPQCMANAACDVCAQCEAMFGCKGPVDACFQSQKCASLSACLQMCGGDMGCLSQCRDKWKDGVKLYRVAACCIDSACHQCPVPMNCGG